MPRRRPGRPASRVLTRERVLETALELLEQHGIEALTLRAVARALGVDPMAIYHYVPDKSALLEAAAALAYARLPERAGTTGTWRQRLESLAVAYLELVGRSGQLLRYLGAGNPGTAEAVRRFDARFRVAVAPLTLAPRHYRAAHDAYVDFLHGFSLAVAHGRVTPALRRRLRAELGVLVAGIRALAA